jgi:hypothetical protein
MYNCNPGFFVGSLSSSCACGLGLQACTREAGVGPFLLIALAVWAFMMVLRLGVRLVPPREM